MTREEAIRDIEECVLPHVGGISLRMAIEDMKEMDRLSKAEPVLKERPHGKWDRGFCSACGKRSLRTTQTGEIFGIEHTPFCKNCGADMRTKDGKICETMMGW